MHDLIIRGGTVVDGTGKASLTADVAVKDGLVVEVGHITEQAKRTMDAQGLLVTPGWVDIHTHYDGQVSWDPYMSPSSWHGVTTAVMGNCGVGFAPAHTHQREWMMELMEGVEDIPGAVLSEGLKWEWESFPEYLDAVAKTPESWTLALKFRMAHCAFLSWANEVPIEKLPPQMTFDPWPPWPKKPFQPVLLALPPPEHLFTEQNAALRFQPSGPMRRSY